jgi:hypothetical protein
MAQQNQPNNQPRKRKPIQKKPTLVSTKVEPPVRNKIPMYDPQTGEPNPLYEELTGKKNPLLELRKNSNNLGNIPVQYEPKSKNRWVVHFPEHFKIESWCVSRTQRPSVKITEKRFLGIRMGTILEWERIYFEFIDPISPSISESLWVLMDGELNETFDYTLEMLDPTGVVIEKWFINDCEIEAINLGRLDYSEDGIAKCTMVVKPGSVILQK